MTCNEASLEVREGVFLSYPGGKARLAKQIVAMMPTHRVYVEPFCGTASVLFAKPRSPFELVNDIDGRLTTLLRVVRDRPQELAHALSLTPYARQEYQDADPDDTTDELEIARRVCVRVGQSFGKHGLAAPSKGWRISTSGGRAEAATWADIPGKVIAACERLRGVSIDNLNALDIITRYGVESDAVMYVDPPYLGETRAKMYAHELTSAEAHRDLATVLTDCKAHVLLSGYDSPLYAELFDGWHRVEMSAHANFNGGPTARTEVLWSNRPLAGQQRLEIA